MTSIIRKEKVVAILSKIVTLTDFKIYKDITERYEFQKQTILDDESLTMVERTEAIKSLTVYYDYQKILYNEGKKRFCEECQQDCFATLYCEHCVRTYLKNDFSNWTSENNYVDDLIQRCQLESLRPDQIIEWIPYDNLQNIEYITKGGCSKVYLADWIDGRYCIWDPKEKQLKRFGMHKVILKRLKDINNANKNWFEEAKSHLAIGNKYSGIVRIYGLTLDPSNNKGYMLVMYLMDTNLRNYLLQHQCTWKEKVNAVYDIIEALYRIHINNAVHQNLHPGNILYSQDKNFWYISDFGFRRPADKSTKCIYGNLPYIAPEAIIGKGYTFASDIYSFGILMWEISSGQIPFNDHEHDYDLAMKIVNGMRPKIVSSIPFQYEMLMKLCWDADPLKRPDARTLLHAIKKMRRDSYDNEFDTLEYNQLSQANLNSNSNTKIRSLSTSKLYQFENLPEPRNATEVEQEAFHSKLHDLCIPVDNLIDFDNDPIKNQDDSESKSINNINEPSNQILKLNIIEDENEIYDNTDFNLEQQNDMEILENNQVLEQTEIKEFDNDPIKNRDDSESKSLNNIYEPNHQTLKSNIIEDENEICNYTDFHSEQQNDMEIPEDNKVPDTTEEQEALRNKSYDFNIPVDNGFDNNLNQDDLKFKNVNNNNNELNNQILKSNIIEEEQHNVEQQYNVEQHNNLEISEDILLNSLIVENSAKSYTIEDNLETPKSKILIKPIIIKEIDKSNNHQFEKIEYNEKNKPNFETRDCINNFKDEKVRQKSGNPKNLKKRFNIIKHVKKLSKLIRSIKRKSVRYYSSKFPYGKNKPPSLENDRAVLNFICDSGKYSPQNDQALREML
ncbi:kinase-like domain-containing protein [Rhizophagus clarus]|uniref:Kinase-like domain-containing protein n=1 Tax=Rhizophagus clarus TaxID=94130 RepID=A0A8H3KNS5_9GLOM|nr:kinase-like domain-containing protein [Rhizophagus clarus]